MDSAKAAVIKVGEVLDTLETRQNDAGVLRICYSGGWVSEKTGKGALCFEAVVEGGLGQPPAGAAPVGLAKHLLLSFDRLRKATLDLCLVLCRCHPARQSRRRRRLPSRRSR